MGRTTFWLLEQEQKAKENTQKEEIDWEEKVKQYAVLNKKGVETGWYDIPGQKNKIQGTEKAIKALKESDN